MFRIFYFFFIFGIVLCTSAKPSHSWMSCAIVDSEDGEIGLFKIFFAARGQKYSTGVCKGGALARPTPAFFQPRPNSVGRVWCVEGTYATFHDNAVLESCILDLTILATDTLGTPRMCTEGSHAFFDRQGVLSECN